MLVFGNRKKRVENNDFYKVRFLIGEMYLFFVFVICCLIIVFRSERRVYFLGMGLNIND